MTTTDSHDHTEPGGGERLGRAAERLARRLAADARRFAERVEEHVGDFAQELRHGWRNRRHDAWGCGSSAYDPGPGMDDVRRVFGDVRDVLGAVIGGIDDFISRVIQDAVEEPWTRVVLNREATCAGCQKKLGEGQEAWVRPRAREFRCLECGKPADKTQSA